MYIKITNGIQEPYTIFRLRSDNPQVSFPKSIPENILVDYKVYPVVLSKKPEVDYTKNVVEAPASLIDGVWTQTWDVVEATPDEINQRILDKEKAIRAERDLLLQESDWVVVKSSEKGLDIPVEWQTYRQNLRDITDQTGFPYSVVWPTKP